MTKPVIVKMCSNNKSYGNREQYVFRAMPYLLSNKKNKANGKYNYRDVISMMFDITVVKRVNTYHKS